MNDFLEYKFDVGKERIITMQSRISQSHSVKQSDANGEKTRVKNVNKIQHRKDFSKMIQEAQEQDEFTVSVKATLRMADGISIQYISFKYRDQIIVEYNLSVI